MHRVLGVYIPIAGDLGAPRVTTPGLYLPVHRYIVCTLFGWSCAHINFRKCSEVVVDGGRGLKGWKKPYKSGEKNNNNDNAVYVYKKLREKVGGRGPDRPCRGTRLSINHDHARPVSVRVIDYLGRRFWRSRRLAVLPFFTRAHGKIEYDRMTTGHISRYYYNFRFLGIVVTIIITHHSQSPSQPSPSSSLCLYYYIVCRYDFLRLGDENVHAKQIACCCIQNNRREQIQSSR